MIRIATLTAVLCLAGCSTSSYCLTPQDYQRARSVPELKPAPDLKVPQSGTALRIPPPPAQNVPFGEVARDAEGDEVVHCLDKPPELPPLEPIQEKPSA